jgi:hypothetical protein
MMAIVFMFDAINEPKLPPLTAPKPHKRNPGRPAAKDFRTQFSKRQLIPYKRLPQLKLAPCPIPNGFPNPVLIPTHHIGLA